MSINLPNHFVKQYSTNVELLLQQQMSILRPLVTVGSYQGESASPVDQFDSIEMTQVTTRFAPMGRVDAAVDRRWIDPVDWELPQMIDTFDKLKLITDPQSIYVQNAVAAANRQIDRALIDAFFGDAKTGKTGSTTTSFGTTLTSSGGNNVAVAHQAASATNLTVAKLREAKRQLMANHVDLRTDPLYCIVSSKEHDSLLQQAQIVSTDFNEKPVLVDGEVTRFLGINIVHCEEITTGTDDAAGTSNMIPVFAKSGMHLGLWNDIQTSVSVRNDISGEPWQVYTKLSLGATRLQEDKVIRVWCR